MDGGVATFDQVKHAETSHVPVIAIATCDSAIPLESPSAVATLLVPISAQETLPPGNPTQIGVTKPDSTQIDVAKAGNSGRTTTLQHGAIYDSTNVKKSSPTGTILPAASCVNQPIAKVDPTTNNSDIVASLEINSSTIEKNTMENNAVNTISDAGTIQREKVEEDVGRMTNVGTTPIPESQSIACSLPVPSITETVHPVPVLPIKEDANDSTLDKASSNAIVVEADMSIVTQAKMGVNNNEQK
jgi:hypothetical protein